MSAVGEVGNNRPPRLLLAGHNLSFAAPIASLARRRGAEVREDLWQGHSSHDEEASAARLAWADAVLCEWCLGNAVWSSRAKHPGQRLVVRFHRMELETPHPAAVELEQVDAMVFVGRHVLERACERYGWDAGDPRLHVIPNGIDVDGLRAAKLPGARFTLAMVGYVPRLKRLDRALDVLDLLRIHDPCYRLLVKGRAPWEYEWLGDRAQERRYFERIFHRVEHSPNLRRAVSFEPYGEDVPCFLRQAGWILSTSEVEGHSVALAEGMASGAAPVVLDRPGAEAQYTDRWVYPDADAAAEAILALPQGALAGEGRAASEYAERWDWSRLGPTWDRLLLRDLGAGAGAATRGVAKVA